MDKAKSQIDWLLAAVLERKTALGYTWDDIANVAKVSGYNMRRYATQIPPREWPESVRKSVFKMLGIRVKLVVEDDHEFLLS